LDIVADAPGVGEGPRDEANPCVPAGQDKGLEDAQGKPRRDLTRELFLPLLGATAGLTFGLYFVGAVVEYRRYESLKLPGAQTIAPLSHDSLVALGGRNLAPPALGAIATAALFLLLVNIARDGSPRSRRIVAFLLVLVTGATAALIALGHVGNWENFAFFLLVEAVALLGWIAKTRNDEKEKVRKEQGLTDQEDRRALWPRTDARAAGLLAFAVAAVASVFVVVHVWRLPVDLEYAHVDLRQGQDACGIYLALTEDNLYIAPAEERQNRNDSKRREFGTRRLVVAIPVADVQRFTLSRKQNVWDDGPPPEDGSFDANC
jgi:hypothetical protein